MKNKLRIILIIFAVYLSTYFIIGRNSTGIEILKTTTFHQKKDSIQIQLFDLEFYLKNESRVKSILKNKGFKKVKINYAENFLNEN